MFSRWQERRLTWVPVVGALVGSALLVLIYRMMVPPDTVAADLAGAAFERERAVAEALGLRLEREERQQTEESLVRFEVPVSEGQCIAVVATASGAIQVGKVVLQREYSNRARHEPTEGLVAHAQYCVGEAFEVQVLIELEHQEGVMGRTRNSSGEVRYAVFTGAVDGGLGGLNRGTLSSNGANDASREDIFREADSWAASRTPYGPSLRIRSFRARLVPETPQTYSVLRGLASNEQHPRPPPAPDITRLPSASPEEWGHLARGAEFEPLTAAGPRPASVPAMAFDGRTPLRVLAVVDAAALGRCVEVRLVRMAWRAPTAARRNGVRRDPPRGAVQGPNFMTDRVCEERAVYITDHDDQTAYELQLYAEPLAAGSSDAEAPE